jgi:putative ABC transport system ATP-binding protein
MSETKNIVEIKDLNVIYHKGEANQVRALDSVNLEFEPQEWVIIFGPSGCGKSTLLNSIAGFETPTSGTINVLGKNINGFDSNEKADYRRNIVGMIFQSFHLINSLKVLDNVCLPQVFFGVDLKKRRELAQGFLDRFNIGDQGSKYPSDISGGQRQKVSIARALMNKPEIILADEPVGNLDSKSTYNVMAILKELNVLDKKTIVMVTHDHAHLAFADRIVYVKDGKIQKVVVVKKNKKAKFDKENKKRMVVTRETIIPNDLRLLMNSFKDLSNSHIGKLLTPFKVKQIFSYLMLPITNYQTDLTQQSMKKFLLGMSNEKQFFDQVNNSMDKGGAGWDKRTAEKFVKEVTIFNEQAQLIDYSEPFKSALALCKFFVKRYPLKKTEYKMNIFKNSMLVIKTSCIFNIFSCLINIIYINTDNKFSISIFVWNNI